MNYGICFLAYGDEHINEFNIVANSLLKIDTNLKLFVGTDSPNKVIDGVYKIIEIKEEFNFNLKRLVIECALKELNTILYLDTDVFIRDGVNLDILTEIANNEGCLIYAAEVVNLQELKDITGSLEYMEDYLNLLKTFHDDLYLVHEGIFVLKIDNDETKQKFISTWANIDSITRPHQKMAYNLLGAMEGIIMYISFIESNINIKIPEKGDKIKNLYNRIIHIGKANEKINKTLI